jgi:hypothetical protein
MHLTFQGVFSLEPIFTIALEECILRVKMCVFLWARACTCAFAFAIVFWFCEAGAVAVVLVISGVSCFSFDNIITAAKPWLQLLTHPYNLQASLVCLGNPRTHVI